MMCSSALQVVQQGSPSTITLEGLQVVTAGLLNIAMYLAGLVTGYFLVRLKKAEKDFTK